MKVYENKVATFEYSMLSDTDVEDHYSPYIRLIEIERNTSQCGFHLTRGKWDPYPWISEVDDGTAAFSAGLKVGDCVLEVNGEDVVGKRISEIAEMVKSRSDQVSLLLWNAGVDSHCTPEALCCGPLPKNLQRLSACMSTILAFMECPVCLDTIPPPTYQCENGHLICIRCRSKSERCPVCRIRLQRGRSLISDQIYNSLIDAFKLKDENEDTRTTKIQQIFKHRKKGNIPDIKITHSYTNKFLTKIIGKASSVDNLSTSTNIHNDSGENLFAKTKSLSTNEIFLSESPVVSRSASVSKMNRKDFNILNKKYEKPASYHGSYESLERKSELTVPQFENPLKNELCTSNDVNYHCPFANNCTSSIKSNDVFEHFRFAHNEEPLIQYFKSNIKYELKDLKGQSDMCHVIFNDNNIFFLKTTLLASEDGDLKFPHNILIWVWYLGGRNSSKDYEVDVELRNIATNGVLLSVRSSVFSLSVTSSKEILKSKKGVFLSSGSLEALGFFSDKVFLNIKIIKIEN